MRSTFSQLYYINRAKVKTDGTTAVMCRITIDGKSTALTTDIYCRPEDWNAKRAKSPLQGTTTDSSTCASGLTPSTTSNCVRTVSSRPKS